MIMDEPTSVLTPQEVEILFETLRKLQAAGVAVYVGGGEGRAALERYASIGDVTHAFTAGGTILKCLAGKTLPFVDMLWMQANLGDGER